MLSIAIVDDHEVVRRGIRAILEAREGWTICCEAADGRAGVSAVCEHRPEVAIVDLGLPGMNGIEVTRQIRRDSPHTEVVICTLHEEESMARDALCAGARAFVLKSDGSEHLMAAVASAASGVGFYSRQYTPASLGCPCGPGEGRIAGPLTPREREIAQLLAEGKTNWCISVILGISVKTVETHRAKILQKLHVESTVELVHYAIRNGIIDA
jgi:DNA-binding NarL/FixJ family response regulator